MLVVGTKEKGLNLSIEALNLHGAEEKTRNSSYFDFAAMF